MNKQREIKFRAWDTINKETVEDIAIYPEYGWLVMSDNDAMEERGRAEEDQFILMQYTGLKDKNGKEIYEGDIIQWNTSDRYDGISIVVWSQSKVCYLLETLEQKDSTEGARWFLEDKKFRPLRGKKLCVVGNIYENPELLK